MNTNQSNQSKNDELFYQNLGSPGLVLDGIQLFLFAPYSFICTVLSLCLFIILQDKSKYNDSIYKQVRITSILNTFICLLVFLFSLVHIPRYASFSYSYPARIYSCILMLPLLVTIYSIITIIHAYSVLFRLSKFVIKFAIFQNILNSNKLMINTVIICFVFNIPLYFNENVQNQREFDQYKNDSTKLNILKRCVPGLFAQSSVYQSVFVIFFTIAYAFVTLVDTILSLLLSFYYNKFLKFQFGIGNLVTMEKTFIKRTNNDNNNNNNESHDTDAKKTPIYVSFAFAVFSLIIIVFGFVLIGQPNSSTFIYVVSFCVINFCFLLKYGNYFILFYKFDTNFRNHVNCIFCKQN